MKKIIMIVLTAAAIICAQETSSQKLTNNIDEIKNAEKVCNDTLKEEGTKISINGKKLSGGHSYGGYGGFMAGFNMFDLSKLNKSLKDHGYKEFDETLFTTGGGGCGIVRDFIIGGEGHGNIPMTRSGRNDSTDVQIKYESSLTIEYGMFHLGYIFYKNNSIFTYVTGGFGGSTIQMHIIEDVPVEFDDLLDNPKREFILKKETYLLDLSLGANYKIGKGGYFLIGFKGGYVFDFTNEDNFNNILDCPDLGLSGPYIKLFIGGGGGIL